MLEVIAALCAGVLAGYALKNKTRLLRAAAGAANAAVFALLLLLGLGIGGNASVLRNLPRLGARAALLGFAGIAGSVAAAAFVSRRFLRRDGLRAD